MPVKRIILLPLSLLYGAVVWLRNVAYDQGWLKSKRGELPTVVVGNIHMGGTGKTPHTLWLAEMLKAYHPGILSRGYGRKTKGFHWVERDAKASDVGDEPLLYRQAIEANKRVAVCEDRLEGIRRFRGEKNTKLILLDDAMQHRKLRADCYIALVRKDRLPADDLYFPAGMLRDHRRRMRDADLVIVTGYDDFSAPVDYDALRKKCHVSLETPVFRSRIDYGMLIPQGAHLELPTNILLVTGIANPTPLQKHLEERFTIVKHFAYADHYDYSKGDLDNWKEALERTHAEAIVTTSKDMTRIEPVAGSELLPLFVQPISVSPEDPEKLLETIQRSLRTTVHS